MIIICTALSTKCIRYNVSCISENVIVKNRLFTGTAEFLTTENTLVGECRYAAADNRAGRICCITPAVTYNYALDKVTLRNEKNIWHLFDISLFYIYGIIGCS